jgi:hypothetical protein
MKKIIVKYYDAIPSKWKTCHLERTTCFRCQGEIEFNVKSEHTDTLTETEITNIAKCKDCDMELIIEEKEETVKISEHSLKQSAYIPMGTKKSIIRR